MKLLFVERWNKMTLNVIMKDYQSHSEKKSTITRVKDIVNDKAHVIVVIQKE